MPNLSIMAIYLAASSHITFIFTVHPLATEASGIRLYKFRAPSNGIPLNPSALYLLPIIVGVLFKLAIISSIWLPYNVGSLFQHINSIKIR